jgi:hypothetical protein
MVVHPSCRSAGMVRTGWGAVIPNKVTMEEGKLTERWYPLRPHPVQIALVTSPARFAVVPAGRRSGKTERAKRKLVRAALNGTDYPDPRFFAAAPTRDQAKRIYWEDLKRLVHYDWLSEAPRESELTLKLITGATIQVIGMDKPERIEGSPWDGGILDEFANMKAKAWRENVRPALSDRKGWCWLIGVPEGRNHYYDLAELAQRDETGEWAFFTWKSSDILDPAEVESARRELDELTYLQEYEGSFLNFQGRIYYCFDRAVHCSVKVAYNPNLPLIFCFDFNVSPGVAAVLQEQPELPNGISGTAAIGEVYIPRNSNTPAVCRKLIQTYGNHKAGVYCYGDATGGNAGSAKVAGSDWDLIRRELRPVYGESLKFMVTDGNPRERSRINSVNSRLRSGIDIVRFMAHPENAKNLVKDLEGVRCLEGGSGEIDKDIDPALTHISDAIGYYIHYKFPTARAIGQREF